MLKSKIFALVLMLAVFGFAGNARATGCDPAVMTAMAAQAQTGFNNMSQVTTSFLRAPVPTLSSLCQQMVNSVWNPQRFIEEALLSVVAFPFVYSYSFGGFSLSFNPINVAASTLLRSLMQSASLGFICTDAFDGIGNALRNVQYDPATGNIKVSASLKASGPVSFINGFLSGAQISFTGNPSQIFP
jgi:hypothetical protein